MPQRNVIYTHENGDGTILGTLVKLYYVSLNLKNTGENMEILLKFTSV